MAAAAAAAPLSAAAQAGFTPDDLLYGSYNGEGVNKKLGSIYFTGGRLRLEHRGGPEIADHREEEVSRFTLENSPEAEAVFRASQKRKRREKKAKVPRHTRYKNQFDTLQAGAGLQPAVVGAPGRLIEFMGREGVMTNFHPSRGNPEVVPKLSQGAIDVLHAAASYMPPPAADAAALSEEEQIAARNAHLRAAMDAHPQLRNIRTASSADVEEPAAQEAAAGVAAAAAAPALQEAAPG